MKNDCKSIDGVKEEKLLVITILRGSGLQGDTARLIDQYYKKQDDGSYKLLFEDDPCQKDDPCQEYIVIGDVTTATTIRADQFNDKNNLLKKMR
ncbi:MAG: hypothetical protein ACLRT4_18260 [Thomasclavelia sp.]